MKTYEKEITKEVYDKAATNDGIVSELDYTDIFSVDELRGYGVYLVRAIKKDGKYYVRYLRGDSCD